MFDMCYTDIMNETYRHSPTTVSLCNYHFIFCPRYRRRIFLLPGVEAFFKERIEEECRLRSIRILAMECHIDHVRLFVNTPPTCSPADIMKWLKGATSLACEKSSRNCLPCQVHGQEAALCLRQAMFHRRPSNTTQTPRRRDPDHELHRQKPHPSRTSGLCISG